MFEVEHTPELDRYLKTYLGDGELCQPDQSLFKLAVELRLSQFLLKKCKITLGAFRLFETTLLTQLGVVISAAIVLGIQMRHCPCPMTPPRSQGLSVRSICVHFKTMIIAATSWSKPEGDIKRGLLIAVW